MIIFTDIDDTLMKTSRKIKDVSNLKVGALNKKGEPLSFIEKKRERLIDEMLDKSITIPVTARSKVSFNNLQLKFNHHAILNFGATIITKDKNLVLSWQQEIMSKSESLNQKELFVEIEKVFAEYLRDFEVKIATEDNIYNYMNFRDYSLTHNKLNSLKIKITDFLKNKGVETSFYFYQTDRDLALIPIFIKKENAVLFLLEKEYSKEDLIVGLGDHKNDLSFMALCDFIMFPTDSMLMKLITKE